MQMQKCKPTYLTWYVHMRTDNTHPSARVYVCMYVYDLAMSGTVDLKLESLRTAEICLALRV